MGLGSFINDAVRGGFAGSASDAYAAAQATGGGAKTVVDSAAGEPMTPEERADHIDLSWHVAERVGPAVLGGVTLVATGGNIEAAQRVAGLTRGVSRFAQKKTGANDVTKEPWERNLWPRSASTMQRQAMRALAAMIQVESGGDPSAISPSGSFFGLLQIGADRAADVGLDDPREVLGDPELAVLTWLEAMEQASQWHQWIPPLMALSWKGGNGTLRKFLRSVYRDGVSPDRAIVEVAPESWHVPRYMSRFASAYRNVR